MAKNDAWTYEGMLAATAKALWDIHQAKRLRGRVSEVLGLFGVTVPDDATGSAAPQFTYPNATEPEDTYVGSGLKLADLTPEARAKREAKRITGLRQNVYAHLRDMAERGQRSPCGNGPNCLNHPPTGANPAEVLRHFDALGFPQPVTHTDIEGYITNGDEGDTYIAVRLPGSITKEDAKARMESVGVHTKRHDLIVAAFGESAHTEPLATSVSVHESYQWANVEDIT